MYYFCLGKWLLDSLIEHCFMSVLFLSRQMTCWFPSRALFHDCAIFVQGNDLMGTYSDTISWLCYFCPGKWLDGSLLGHTYLTLLHILSRQMTRLVPSRTGLPNSSFLSRQMTWWVPTRPHLPNSSILSRQMTRWVPTRTRLASVRRIVRAASLASPPAIHMVILLI